MRLIVLLLLFVASAASAQSDDEGPLPLTIHRASALERSGAPGSILGGESLVVLARPDGSVTISDCAAARVQFRLETPAAAGDASKTADRAARVISVAEYGRLHPGDRLDGLPQIRVAPTLAVRDTAYVCIATNQFRLATVVGQQFISATVLPPYPTPTNPESIPGTLSVAHIARAVLSRDEHDRAFRPGTYYRFAPIYAVAAPRPLIGYAFLGRPVPIGRPDASDPAAVQDSSSTPTTVGTDLPLSLLFRNLAPGALQHVRVHLATTVDAPGQHLFIGLSVGAALFGARTGELPLDATLGARIGPSSEGFGDRLYMSVQVDLASALEKTKGALGL